MDDEKIIQLKEVYDELWQDAKTMIKDMKGSIALVFLFGIVMFAFFAITIGIAIEMYSKIAMGSTRALDYFYLVGTAFGSIVAPAAGISMLRFYYRLNKRYAKLIQLEKTIED